MARGCVSVCIHTNGMHVRLYMCVRTKTSLGTPPWLTSSIKVSFVNSVVNLSSLAVLHPRIVFVGKYNYVHPCSPCLLLQ